MGGRAQAPQQYSHKHSQATWHLLPCGYFPSCSYCKDDSNKVSCTGAGHPSGLLVGLTAWQLKDQAALLDIVACHMQWLSCIYKLLIVRFERAGVRGCRPRGQTAMDGAAFSQQSASNRSSAARKWQTCKRSGYLTSESRWLCASNEPLSRVAGRIAPSFLGPPDRPRGEQPSRACYDLFQDRNPDIIVTTDIYVSRRLRCAFERPEWAKLSKIELTDVPNSRLRRHAEQTVGVPTTAAQSRKRYASVPR